MGNPKRQVTLVSDATGVPKNHNARDVLHKWLKQVLIERSDWRRAESKANLTMGLVALVKATSIVMAAESRWLRSKRVRLVGDAKEKDDVILVGIGQAADGVRNTRWGRSWTGRR